jgi:hypothetical protein
LSIGENNYFYSHDVRCAHSTAVSQQLHHDSLIALASEQQVKEAIAMYRQLKVQD